MRNNKLELYINGNLVDVESTEQLAQQFALTISFSDLYKPDAITDTYSKEIQLPGTNRNNQIFGSIWRIDADNYTVFNPSTLSNFKVLLNGELWKTGSVQLKRINVRNKNVTYYIVLYGVITGLFSTLLNNDPDDPENKLMRSLPYPNDLRHSINSEYIYNDWYRTTEHSQYFHYVPCQNGLHENFESSKWLTKWGSANSPICCQDITACEPPTENASTGDITIPDGTGMNFDEYRLGEYRSQYQRPALRVKKAVELILDDIAPDYDVSLDTTDFFSESDQVSSPYNSVFMTLNQYNTEKGDEEYSSAYNQTEDHSIINIKADGQPAVSSSNILMYINRQVEGTYNILHNSYFNLDEIPAQQRVIEVEFGFRVGLNAGSIRPNDQYVCAFSNSPTHFPKDILSTDPDEPVKIEVVAIQNNEVLAVGTPMDTNCDPLENGMGGYTYTKEQANTYMNSQIFSNNIRNPKNNVYGYDAWKGGSYTKVKSHYMNGYWYMYFSSTEAEYPEYYSNTSASLPAYTRPMKQRIDVSSIEGDFRLYVRVSNLDKLYVVRADKYMSTQPITSGSLRFDVLPIQKITYGDYRPFPYNHNFRGVDARVNFINKIVSGSIVSKYDMLDDSLSQGEFLLSLTKLTGCLYDVDKEGKVTIKSRNAFFNGYKILDWSDKLDYSKDIVYDPLTFDTRKLSMKYNPGDSYYEEKYKKLYNTEYGEKRINTGYAYNTNTTELLADDMIFQNVVICKDNDIWALTCGNSTVYTSKIHPLMMPAFYKREGDDKKPSNNKYGLVFMGNIMDTDAIYITDDNPLMFDEDLGGNEDNPCWINSETGNATVNSTIYMPGSEAYPAHIGHWIYEMPTWTNFKHYGGNYNYDWNITRPTANYAGWTSDTYPEGTGVYDRFWKNYITEIYNVKNKIMTAYFNLTAEDLLNFHFRNFVIINNTIWHPNKVFDINPLSDATTKVELIKVTDISSYTSGQNLTWVEE